MSLKRVHEKLLKIKDTSSSNDKISLLTEYLKDDEFKLVIKLMYDEFKHFYINKLQKYKKIQYGLLDKQPTNEELFSFLNQLSSQSGATNADKEKLRRLASMDEETYEVVKKIINKDAKCGFAGKLINKAHPDLIFLMPYCRCSTAKNKMHNINYELGAFLQEKADGMFVNIIIDKNGEIVFRSRNGYIVHQMDHLKAFLKLVPKKYQDTVYMGELLIKKNGKILPRQTGNGILNSCIQNKEKQKDAKYAIIKLWDAVPYAEFFKGESKIAYKHRFNRIRCFIKDMSNIQPNTLIGTIFTKKVYSLKEARSYYKKLRREGKEGAIVKNIHALWKAHTSPDQVKMKNVSDIELRIVGWKYGKEGTRFENCMGSVQLESDDGYIKVSVSGFTDEERLEDWDSRIGKIATIEYEGHITDKSRNGIYSLYLPQNLELRPDRNDTDTLEDAKKR